MNKQGRVIDIQSIREWQEKRAVCGAISRSLVLLPCQCNGSPDSSYSMHSMRHINCIFKDSICLTNLLHREPSLFLVTVVQMKGVSLSLASSLSYDIRVYTHTLTLQNENAHSETEQRADERLASFCLSLYPLLLLLPPLLIGKQLKCTVCCEPPAPYTQTHLHTSALIHTGKPHYELSVCTDDRELFFYSAFELVVLTALDRGCSTRSLEMRGKFQSITPEVDPSTRAFSLVPFVQMSVTTPYWGQRSASDAPGSTRQRHFIKSSWAIDHKLLSPESDSLASASDFNEAVNRTARIERRDAVSLKRRQVWTFAQWYKLLNRLIIVYFHTLKRSTLVTLGKFKRK